MSAMRTRAPVNPSRHRAHLAAIYATLPPEAQREALRLVEGWPRMIHTLARAGELDLGPASTSRKNKP